MIIVNSVSINAAADAMWRWEQTGRRDDVLRNEANEHVRRYCEMHGLPLVVSDVVLDAIQITVRIANGFPNIGVAQYDDEAKTES